MTRYRTIVAKVYWITTDATGYALLAFNNEEMARRHADKVGRVVVEVEPCRGLNKRNASLGPAVSSDYGSIPPPEHDESVNAATCEAPSDEAFRAARAAYDAGDDLEDALIAAYAIDCPARSWRDTGCICPDGEVA